MTKDYDDILYTYVYNNMENNCSCFREKIPPKKIALYSCVEEYVKCPKYDENGNRIHGMSVKCKLCIRMYLASVINDTSSHLHCSICKKKVYPKFYPENNIYHQGIKCDEYVK